jgi:hypothetical protein
MHTANKSGEINQDAGIATLKAAPNRYLRDKINILNSEERQVNMLVRDGRYEQAAITLKGMENIAALSLPGFDERLRRLETRRVVVLDCLAEQELEFARREAFRNKQRARRLVGKYTYLAQRTATDAMGLAERLGMTHYIPTLEKLIADAMDLQRQSGTT